MKSEQEIIAKSIYLKADQFWKGIGMFGLDIFLIGLSFLIPVFFGLENHPHPAIGLSLIAIAIFIIAKDPAYISWRRSAKNNKCDHAWYYWERRGIDYKFCPKCDTLMWILFDHRGWEYYSGAKRPVHGNGFDSPYTKRYLPKKILFGIEQARIEYANQTGTAYAKQVTQPDGKTKVEIEPNATVVHGESGEKYVITGNPPMCARVVEG